MRSGARVLEHEEHVKEKRPRARVSSFFRGKRVRLYNLGWIGEGRMSIPPYPNSSHSFPLGFGRFSLKYDYGVFNPKYVMNLWVIKNGNLVDVC
jgi:hypothetical protein